jgi:pimeloyl-ACP methyl ester carboxylesterase
MTTLIRGEELTVFTYRPDPTSTSGILFLFDGLRRDASGIRNKAIVLAKRADLVTCAPLMDRNRFPNWRYSRAGVIRRGQKQPREHWTGPLVQKLFEWMRDLIDQPSARFFLFGHSAGGQMLSRMCAYSPLSGTERIVITNPSAYVGPWLDEPAPFGFKNIFAPGEAAARLQAYLALPITIYLGQKDVENRNLITSEAAMRQGANRLARGRSIYKASLEVARQHAWAFNWRLVEAPGIGHSSRAMLETKQCYEALGIKV